MEKSIYHEAESVVALSPAIQSAIAEKIPGKKIHVVSNMADCDFFMPTQKESSLERKFNIQGKFVVSYVGALGVANGLEYFLECANASRKTNLSIHFLLCGDGAMLDPMKAIASKLNLQNLSILPFTNREGVGEIMNVTDASFICYKNVPIHRRIYWATLSPGLEHFCNK